MIEADRIDVIKSINNNRLYLKRNKTSRFLITGIEVAIIAIIPFSSVIISLKNISFFNQGYALYIVLANLAALLLGFLLFKLFTGGKKLKRITGNSLAENKERLLNIFSPLNWEVYDEASIMIAIPNWKTQVTILFDGKDILLNTIRFGRSQTQGMFDEGLYLYIKEKLNELDGQDTKIA